MLLHAKAPVRVSFGGGGTDIPPYPDMAGGLVFSATIARYVHGSLRSRQDGLLRVRTIDPRWSPPGGDDGPDGLIALPAAALRAIGRHPCLDEGFELLIWSDVPAGSGLGSSSALMVLVLALLRTRLGCAPTPPALAALAVEAEREHLGVPCGYQDAYASAFGGFNIFQFGPGRVGVHRVHLPAEVVSALEQELILFSTGRVRRSGPIIGDHVRRLESADPHTLAALQRQKELAVEMRDALLTGATEEFGALLDEAWRAKKQASSRVSNPAIDELYDEARRAGITGGKITGAGGGGFFLAHCRPDRRAAVVGRLARLGLEPTPLAFESAGLRSWRAL